MLAGGNASVIDDVCDQLLHNDLQSEEIFVGQPGPLREIRSKPLELGQLGAVGDKIGGYIHGKQSSTSETSSSNTDWLLSARSCSMIQAAAFS